MYLVVLLLLTLYGYFYFQSNKTFFRNSASQELAVVADLKLNSILIWKNQRLEDALSLQKQTKLPELMSSLIKNPTNGTVQNEILERISILQSVNQYEVFFIDTQGRTFFTFPKNVTPLCEIVINEIPKSLTTKQITFIDLHRSHIDERINIGILIPIFQPNNTQKIIGFVNLRIDPTLFLYPMLQKWPNDSISAETLLLRKDGLEVLYLNDLRFKNDTALKLSVPLTKIKTPAVQAVMGRIGYFEGLDYRGEMVVSELRPIPNSEWFMVAKIDQSEIFVSLYSRQRQLTVWLFVISILILAFLMGMFKRNQNLFLKNRDEKKKIKQDYEDKVMEANEKANLYLSLVASIIVVIDKDEKVSMINFAGCKLLGYPREEIIGKNWFDTFLVQEDIAKVKQAFSKIISGHIENVEYFENQVVTKSGERKDIAWHNNLLMDTLGQIIGTVSSGEDFTNRKQAQKDLAESEEKFRVVFENSTVPKSLSSPQGKLLKVNQAFANMLGYELSEIENLNFASITFPEDIPASLELIRCLLADEKQSMSLEKRYIHRSGEVIWAALGTYLYRNANHEPLFFITSVVDITARKKAEQALQKLNEDLEEKVKARTAELQISNKELEAFAYTVSHDLRAPLRSIDGFSKMLLDEYGTTLDEEAKRLLTIIRKSSHTMDQLIFDLLTMAKVTRAQMKIDKINMQSLALSVYEELVSQDEKEKINFTIKTLPDCFGDSSLIRQVWANLILNAVKFTSKKTNRIIIVKGEREKDRIVYSVSDNGVGFNPNYKEKLFGAFQRLHSSNEFEGTGIGLTIVDRIITRHSGTVWGEGTEGVGATFYFSLPKE